MSHYSLDKIATFRDFSIKYFGTSQNGSRAGSSIMLVKEAESIIIHFMSSYAEQLSPSSTLRNRDGCFIELKGISYTKNSLYEVKGSIWPKYLNTYRERLRSNLSVESKRIYKHYEQYDGLFRKEEDVRHFFSPMENDVFFHVLAKEIQIISNGSKTNVFSEYLKKVNIKML